MRGTIVIAAVLAGGACGEPATEGPRGEGSPTPAETPAGTPETALPTPVRQWVGVFDTAGHPDGLDPSTAELLDSAGGNIAVQPIQCWDGLAADLEVDPGVYAAAVITTSEDDLATVVEAVGRGPIGTGEYRAFCLD